jgi:hypothetical protein
VIDYSSINLIFGFSGSPLSRQGNCSFIDQPGVDISRTPEILGVIGNLVKSAFLVALGTTLDLDRIPFEDFLAFAALPVRHHDHHYYEKRWKNNTYSYALNWSFVAPQTGHTQSSGSFEKGVPGFMPLSGSPLAGSYT